MNTLPSYDKSSSFVMDQDLYGVSPQPRRFSRFFPSDQAYDHVRQPENAHKSHQDSRLGDDVRRQSDRWSRISNVTNWRWSRSVLEPDSLAVFQPLTHEPPHLQLQEIPDTAKYESLCYEGKNIADEVDDAVVPIKGFDRDLSTRNLSILGLAFGILLGIASLTLGSCIISSGKVPLPSFLLGKWINMGNMNYPFPSKTAKHYLSDHRVFSMPEAAVLTASLSLNTLLTLVFDTMNYIQTCTLRWALWREGRLEFNSNPRLFTSAGHFIPNSWYMNLISCVALILGYGSAALLTTNIFIAGFSDPKGRLILPSDPQGWALDINGWSLAGLGIALLLQGLICTLCLIRSNVPTWSSNPLNTARVCAFVVPDNDPLLHSSFHADVNRTPIHHSTHGAFLAVPLPVQQPMRNAVPRSRLLTKIMWTVFSIIALWTITVGAVGKHHNTCSGQYVQKWTRGRTVLGYWQTYCQVSFKYLNFSASDSPYFDRRDWLGLIVTCLVLSFISLGLHCAEVLTEMTRDEAIWRRATTQGANPMAGSITQAALSWQCWILFAFKCVVPSIFAYAFVTNLSVFMSFLPLLSLSVLFLLLGIFGEFLVRHKPKGPQPATYGNIEALVALVDEWHDDKIFWGDKGAVTDTVRRAGTSGQRLADLRMSYLYMGLRG